MKRLGRIPWLVAVLLVAGCAGPGRQARKAADSITARGLKYHLDFLASDEFHGRGTPSPELEIASLYIASQIKRYGLLPVFPEGGYFQELPLDIDVVDRARTRMRLPDGGGDPDFTFPEDFGIPGRSYDEAEVSGELLFAGLGFSAPEQGWDDLEGWDFRGRMVVILDAQLPEGHPLRSRETGGRFRRRARVIASRGAAAVLSVVSPDREDRLEARGAAFDDAPRCRPAAELKASWIFPSTPAFPSFEIRHRAAARLLGVTRAELEEMFAQLQRGERVRGRNLSGRELEIRIQVHRRRGACRNVAGMVEGRDEKFKDEYVLLGAHHDHLGAREGGIYNGADDNGSGTVALLEIARALMLHRPRRSVILVWHTAEEKGLWGSRFFMENSPVPVEKMSAEINLDMLCRNDPADLYLIGSNKLSSQLDAALHAANRPEIGFRLDYTYQDPGHPENFFFRSDHYPYIQYGVPAVWIFCGTTEDYHTENDTLERVDYDKMLRAARLTYFAALKIGDLPDLLLLDLHPEIKTRGAHNLKVKWR